MALCRARNPGPGGRARLVRGWCAAAPVPGPGAQGDDGDLVAGAGRPWLTVGVPSLVQCLSGSDQCLSDRVLGQLFDAVAARRDSLLARAAVAIVPARTPG